MWLIFRGLGVRIAGGVRSGAFVDFLWTLPSSPLTIWRTSSRLKPAVFAIFAAEIHAA